MERPIECEHCKKTDENWVGRDEKTLCLWCGHDRTSGDAVEEDWEIPEYLEKSGDSSE